MGSSDFRIPERKDAKKSANKITNGSTTLQSKPGKIIIDDLNLTPPTFNTTDNKQENSENSRYTVNQRNSELSASLKELGLIENDINRLLNGEISLDDLLDEIDKDPVRKRLLLNNECLQNAIINLQKEGISLNTNITNLEELDEYINKLQNEFNSYYEELNNYEEYNALGNIILMLETGTDLDSALESTTVAYKYTDANGEIHYISDEPEGTLIEDPIKQGKFYIEGKDGRKYESQNYKERYGESNIIKELRSNLSKEKSNFLEKTLLKQNDEVYKYDKNSDQSKYIEALKQKVSNDQKKKEEVEAKLYSLYQELGTCNYLKQEVTSEVNYYMENINPYVMKDDFKSNNNFDTKSLETLENIKEKYNIKAPFQEPSLDVPKINITDKKEEVDILSCIINGEGNITNGYLFLSNTTYELTSNDELINHYAIWSSEMSSKEKEIFNYLYNTDESREEAYQYLKSISKDLDKRWLATKTKEDKEFATQYHGLASLGSVVITPIEGMSALCYSLKQYANEKINSDDKTAQIFRTDIYSSGDIWRNTVAEDIAKSDGNLASFAYSTGMSMIDSISLIGATFATGGAGSLALSAGIMGSRAYVSTLNNALDRGLSDGQAVILASSSAIVETAMEHASLGHLLNLEKKLGSGTIKIAEEIASGIENEKVAKVATKSFYILANSLSQGLAEGEEELATEVLNYISDIATAKDLSEYSKSIEYYLNNGYTENEAIYATLNNFKGQLQQAFAGGFVSGICFGGFHGIRSTINTSYAISNQMYTDLNGTTEAEQFASALKISQQQIEQMYKKKNNAKQQIKHEVKAVQNGEETIDTGPKFFKEMFDPKHATDNNGFGIGGATVITPSRIMTSFNSEGIDTKGGLHFDNFAKMESEIFGDGEYQRNRTIEIRWVNENYGGELNQAATFEFPQQISQEQYKNLVKILGELKQYGKEVKMYAIVSGTELYIDETDAKGILKFAKKNCVSKYFEQTISSDEKTDIKETNTSQNKTAEPKTESEAQDKKTITKIDGETELINDPELLKLDSLNRISLDYFKKLTLEEQIKLANNTVLGKLSTIFWEDIDPEVRKIIDDRIIDSQNQYLLNASTGSISTAITAYMMSNEHVLENLSDTSLIRLIALYPKTYYNDGRQSLYNEAKKRIEEGKTLITTEITSYNSYQKDMTSALKNIKNYSEELYNQLLQTIEEKIKYASSNINAINAQNSTNIQRDILEHDFGTISQKITLANLIINGRFDNSSMQLFNELLSENINNLKTFNFNLLDKEIILDFGKEFILEIGNTPELGETISSMKEINPNTYKLLTEMMKNNSEDNSLKNKLFKNLAILDFLNNNQEILNSKSISDIDSFMNYILMYESEFGKIERKTVEGSKRITLNYSDNYETEFIKKCDSEFEEQVNKAKEAISQNNNEAKEKAIENLKNILFQKYFSIDYTEANYLYTKYGSHITEVSEYLNTKGGEQLKTVLEYIDLVNKKTSIEEIAELYNNKDLLEIRINREEMLFLDEIGREAYAKTYEEALSKTKEKLKSLKGTLEQYNGKQVRVVEMTDNISIIVHSSDSGFGAGTEERQMINNNYVETWKNFEDPRAHAVSTSFLTEYNLGCAPVKGIGVLYGFLDLTSNDIYEMAPYDLGSMITRFGFFSYNQELFVSASNMNNNTTRIYNEFVISRKNEPSCIVLFTDASEEIKNNSYKAASEWNIPIIMIDKTKVVQQQMGKVSNLMAEFETTKNFDKLLEAIKLYEATASGLQFNKQTNSNSEVESLQQVDNSYLLYLLKPYTQPIKSTLMSYIRELTEKSDANQLKKVINSLKELENAYDIANKNGTSLIPNTEPSFAFSGAKDYAEKHLQTLE